MKASTDWERMYKESQKEVERLERDFKKAKADAFKSGLNAARKVIDEEEDKINWGYDGDFGVFSNIDKRLDKLERGEV